MRCESHLPQNSIMGVELARNILVLSCHEFRKHQVVEKWKCACCNKTPEDMIEASKMKRTWGTRNVLYMWYEGLSIELFWYVSGESDRRGHERQDQQHIF